jgi:hypothetical protein
MSNITIGQKVIPFPASGTDANWSGPVIAFAQAVADQLATVASQFDISPRVLILTSNSNTNVPIPNAIFPSGSVRSFIFSYAIYRTDGVTALDESGTVTGVYNSLSASWDLEHEFQGARQASGAPYHTFSISGDQIQISTVALTGTYDATNSKISYSAKTLLTQDL